MKLKIIVLLTLTACVACSEDSVQLDLWKVEKKKDTAEVTLEHQSSAANSNSNSSISVPSEEELQHQFNESLAKIDIEKLKEKFERYEQLEQQIKGAPFGPSDEEFKKIKEDQQKTLELISQLQREAAAGSSKGYKKNSN